MIDLEELPHLLTSIPKKLCTLALGLVIITSLLSIYLISVPVFIFRYVLTKWAKIFRPELGSIISAQGNLFSSDFFSSKAPRCSLVVPMVFEGHYTEELAYRWFSQMLEAKDEKTGRCLYPEFKQYLEKWFGFPFWRNDPHFDIRNHVKYSADNNNEKSAIGTEKEAIPFIEQLLNRKFDPKRSPWEMYICSNYKDSALPQEGPKTLLIMRLHHTLADGYSILYALVEGLLQSSLASRQLPIANYAKRGKWSKLFFNLTIPLRLLSDVSDYTVKGLRSNPLLVADWKKSWKHIYGRGEPFPIEKIKKIKDELRVSFTSVLLAAISASMSKIMKAKNKKGNDGQGDIERAAFFIPLPLPDHPNALRNHVTGAQIDLPMASYSDPTFRVKDCEALVKQQKNSTVPMFLAFAGKTLGLHFSSVCGALSANQVNIGGLTSFPAGGSPLEIRDTGNKVLSIELAAGALTGVSGVAFMAISYEKQMRFAVTAESAVLNRKDVDGLLRLLVEELELLYDMVVMKKKLDIPPSC